MFFMSNWSLLASIINKWVKHSPAIHPSVPFVHLLLVVLSILVAVETVIALTKKRPAYSTD